MLKRKIKAEYDISFLKSIKEILNERYQNCEDTADRNDIQVINIRLESLIERAKS